MEFRSQLTGIVKWYSPCRGYGFITGSDGKDFFVHNTEIISSTEFRILHEGQQVSFLGTESPKGFLAKNVRVITPQEKSGLANMTARGEDNAQRAG